MHCPTLFAREMLLLAEALIGLHAAHAPCARTSVGESAAAGWGTRLAAVGGQVDLLGACDWIWGAGGGTTPILEMRWCMCAVGGALAAPTWVRRTAGDIETRYIVGVKRNSAAQAPRNVEQCAQNTNYDHDGSTRPTQRNKCRALMASSKNAQHKAAAPSMKRQSQHNVSAASLRSMCPFGAPAITTVVSQ